MNKELINEKKNSIDTSDLDKKARVWAIFGFVFAIVYFIIGIDTKLEGLKIPVFHSVFPFAYKDITWIWIFYIFIGLMFAIGGVSIILKEYSKARVLYFIGGIVGLPLGIVMMFAAGMLKKIDNLVFERKYNVKIPNE